MNRRQFVGLASAGATASIAGCIGGMDDEDADEIKIGLLAYDFGRTPQGTAQEQVAELAVAIRCTTNSIRSATLPRRSTRHS